MLGYVEQGNGLRMRASARINSARRQNENQGIVSLFWFRRMEKVSYKVKVSIHSFIYSFIHSFIHF